MVFWLLLALGASFPQPYVLKNTFGDLEIDLKVAPIDLSIGPCRLTVRGYHYRQNKEWIPSVPGPTIRVWPGQHVKLTVHNRLEWQNRTEEENGYAHPNSTNIHLHGPHMEPREDYITNEIEPQDTFTYKYSFVKEHYPGTHWYHAHEHGSVTYQVGGGMAGAFIVQPRNPFWWPRSLWRVPHLVAVLQTWNFDNSGGTGSGFGLDTFLETSEEIGDTMPSNLQCQGEQNDFITINGEFKPTLDILSNERVVLNFINTAGGYVMEIEAPGCSLWVLSRDGIYLDEIYKASAIVLLQGSRADVGLQCSESGTFYVKNFPSSSRDSWLGNTNRHIEQVIFEVNVSWLKQWLPGSFDFKYPKKPAYLADLFDAEVKENFHFGFDRGMINNLLWNETVTYTMKEGEVYAFHLSSDGIFSHPYHQHINHFQVIESPLLALDSEHNFVKKGMWLDVINTMPDTEIRFLADKFAGRILIHCHLLRHSDGGMMQFLEIRD